MTWEPLDEALSYRPSAFRRPTPPALRPVLLRSIDLQRAAGKKKKVRLQKDKLLHALWWRELKRRHPPYPTASRLAPRGCLANEQYGCTP